jgi:glycosyltransferase involved in cell wall biosynthesis
MIREQSSRLAVVIPAYRPSSRLVDIVRALAEKSLSTIVVIDDGSGAEFHEIFAGTAAVPGVQLLRHAVNLGKGAALKTGINHALCNIPGIAGVVTADADGQHDPEDIERVAERLLENPESLVLGCRKFRGDVPLRSRIGNVATSAIMHALMGRKMADTQTGLRGIPASFAMRLLKIEATGYEFELEMLLAAHQLAVSLIEEPIRTIYEEGNQSSHFNPIVDSMKIYFVLLRFGSVSALTAVLDGVVFYLTFRSSGHVLISQVLGRVFGVAFNYSIVRSSVFYSHQTHKKVLPKYLALVLASGTVSYAGIRLLSSKLGVGAVTAKVMVEALLFLVNFAVQRLFIFKPENGARTEESPVGESRVAGGHPRGASRRSAVLMALVLLVFLGVLATEVYGFGTGKLFSQEIWMQIGLKRATRFVGMFAAIAAPVLLMVPWLFAALMTALAAIGTVFSVGPMPLLTVAFFLISSCALGARLLGRRDAVDIESQIFSTMLGIAVWIFAMTMVARLGVNFPGAWGAALALPIVFDLRGTWRRLAGWGQVLRRAELRSPAERGALAVLILVLLAHWFAALMPETSADGLAMHMAIPANIAANHRLTYEPSVFIWAVMPMAADMLYSIQYVLGGEYAAHLVDFTMLLLLEALLYCVVRRWVSRASAFLLMALFATTPLAYLASGSLFVENVLAAFVFGFMAALWRFAESGERRYIYLSAVLGGTALATKFGALAFVALALPFAIWEIVRHRKQPRRVAVCALFIVLLLAAALPPYAISYIKTQGNPLFPFLNQKFHSPLLPLNPGIVDERYRRPLNWITPFDLTFRSHLTYEGQDGSFGFQYLLLAPLAVLAVFFVRRRPAVSGGIVALGAAVAIMLSQPNARYLYAALPLLYVPFAAIVGWARAEADRRRWLYRALIGFVVACILMNAYFLPSSSYYHRDFCLRLPFSHAERDRFIGEAVPIRKVIAYYNDKHPNSTVLLANDAALAGLSGTVYENHWHQYNNLMRIRETLTVPDMVRLMQNWHIQYFIATKPGFGEELRPAALGEMLERCTEPEYEIGDQYLAALQPTCKPRQERPAVVVSRGFYDDFDPALLFRGDWNKDRGFQQPDLHTISYSDIPGSEVQIDFEGHALKYVYTKAFNRGIAEIVVDGVSQGELDLYSAETQWQTVSRFCCFGDGKHVAVIRVSGRANAKSRGMFVDLDSFVVE